MNLDLAPVRARDLLNQLAKKLVSSLTISPVRCVKARTQKQNLLSLWRWLGLIFSWIELYLANCRSVHVSVQCCLFCDSLSKNLVFMPAASAMTSIHRDRLVLAANALWPEIQPLVSWGQIISTDPLLVTDGHCTTNIMINVATVHGKNCCYSCWGILNVRVHTESRTYQVGD